ALAADLLREPDATIGSVARKVGYGSPFALSAGEVAAWSPDGPDAAAVSAYRPPVSTSAVTVPLVTLLSLFTGCG
ncbi:hypothetical protein AB0J64_57150, partial [Nonomuraea sp. NPDC049695]